MATEINSQNSSTATPPGRTVFVEWCFGKLFPAFGNALLPLILVGVFGAAAAHYSAKDAAQDVLKEQKAQIQSLQESDVRFEKMLQAERESTAKRLDKIESSITVLDNKTLPKDTFNAYWDSYKQDKEQRERLDGMILNQLQRLNP